MQLPTLAVLVLNLMMKMLEWEGSGCSANVGGGYMKTVWRSVRLIVMER